MSDYIAGGRRVGDIPRTTDATDAAAVARILARRRGPSTAALGAAMVIASEATLLSAFIGAYFYLRSESPAWPPAGIPVPAVVVPMILVACLLTTSVPMQLAWRAVRAGRLARARLALCAALLVQCGYFAYEVQDFSQGFSITKDAYTSIYYTLLGADHAHVFVGILLNLWLLWRLAGGLTTYRANAVHAVSLYWHFVNLYTLLVIGVLLTPNL